MMSRVIRLLVVLISAVLFLTGCYWTDVQPNQMGVITTGGAISDIAAPGRHFSADPRTDLHTYDGSAKTVGWSDPNLVTRDKQPIEFQLVVTYARKRDPKSVADMWTQYHAEATSDEALQQQVLAKVPSAAKTVSVRYTLDELIGTNDTGEEIGRTRLSAELAKELESDLHAIGVALLDINVSDINPGEQYLKLLEEKANIGLQRQVNTEQKRLLDEQLEKEKSQTAIELEQAERANKVAAERAKAYDQSDRAYELERLARLEKIIGPNDKIIFAPDGASLTMLFSDGTTEMVPVPQPESDGTTETVPVPQPEAE